MVGAWWAMSMLVASAAEPAVPAWADLAPWRTYGVVEHVTQAHHWYVLEESAGFGKRCEVRVDVQGGAPAIATCGVETVAVAGAHAPTGSAKASLRKAGEALAETLVHVTEKQLKGHLVYVGTLRQVTFRQVVVTGEPGPTHEVRALTWSSTWSVDVDTGRVTHGLVPARVGVEALCTPGLHTHCAGAPQVMAWSPPPAYEGLLLDPRDARVRPEDLEPLDAMVRQIGMGDDVRWRATSPRTVDPGLLPSAYNAGMVFTLVVQTVGTSSDGAARFEVDVPLNEAAFRPVSVRLPIEGVPAALQLKLDVPNKTFELQVRPERDRYVADSASITCDLVVDGDRAALPESCELAWRGVWLTWSSADGKQLVSVQVGEQVSQLPGPSAGPRVLPPPAK